MNVTGPGQILELVDEDIVICDAIGDRGDYLDIANEADHTGHQRGIGTDALAEVALQVV